jgi:hypothetical protein
MAERIWPGRACQRDATISIGAFEGLLLRGRHRGGRSIRIGSGSTASTVLGSWW